MSDMPGLLQDGVLKLYNGFNQTVEDDSFHFGGTHATEALSEKLRDLQVDSNWHVLDLCCGWGGASRYIATRFGCRVSGIDLNGRSVPRAQASVQGTAAEDLAIFLQANALDLPIRSGTVDLIWSQDAICHIPDRTRLLAECFRVIRPGGHLVFTDLLSGEYLTEEEFETYAGLLVLPQP